MASRSLRTYQARDSRDSRFGATNNLEARKRNNIIYLNRPIVHRKMRCRSLSSSPSSNATTRWDIAADHNLSKLGGLLYMSVSDREPFSHHQLHNSPTRRL
jgi:hypothetical protein